MKFELEEEEAKFLFKCAEVSFQPTNHMLGEYYSKLKKIKEKCGLVEKTFPIKTSVYLHSNKESMYDKGKELGLSKEAISDNFSHCCYEVKVNIEVYEDGKYKILGIE